MLFNWNQILFKWDFLDAFQGLGRCSNDRCVRNIEVQMYCWKKEQLGERLFKLLQSSWTKAIKVHKPLFFGFWKVKKLRSLSKIKKVLKIRRKKPHPYTIVLWLFHLSQTLFDYFSITDTICLRRLHIFKSHILLRICLSIFLKVHYNNVFLACAVCYSAHYKITHLFWA